MADQALPNLWGRLVRLPQTPTTHPDVFDLSRCSVVVGRQKAKVDLYLNDSRVSAVHFKLKYYKGVVKIVDVSTNGTFVNDEVVLTEVEHNDVISLCTRDPRIAYRLEVHTREYKKRKYERIVNDASADYISPFFMNTEHSDLVIEVRSPDNMFSGPAGGATSSDTNQKSPNTNDYKYHESTEFPVHRIVICPQSPVFSAMIKQPFKEKEESRIIIQGVEAPVFKAVLRWLYTRKVTMRPPTEKESLDTSPSQHFSGPGVETRSSARKRLKLMHQAASAPSVPPGLIEIEESYVEDVVNPEDSETQNEDTQDDDALVCDVSFLVKVMLVADRYGISKLAAICCLILCRAVSIENVGELALRIHSINGTSLCNVAGMKEIWKECLVEIARDFKTFQKSRWFDKVFDNIEMRHQILNCLQERHHRTIDSLKQPRQLRQVEL